jgi:hypothetical protein
MNKDNVVIGITLVLLIAFITVGVYGLRILS